MLLVESWEDRIFNYKYRWKSLKLQHVGVNNANKPVSDPIRENLTTKKHGHF